MAFDIQEFKSIALNSRNGVLPTNRFVFSFGFPKSGEHPFGYRYSLSRELRFYCHAIGIPARNIDVATHRRYGVGFNERNVINGSIQDVTATFIADGNGEMMSLFDDWMEYMTGSGKHITQDPDMFTVPYRDDYVLDGKIEVYDYANKVIKVYRLVEMFPTAFTDTQLNWENQNTFYTFNVTFSVFNMQLNAEISAESASTQLQDYLNQINGIPLQAARNPRGFSLSSLTLPQIPHIPIVSDLVNIPQPTSILQSSIQRVVSPAQGGISRTLRQTFSGFNGF